MKKILLGLLSLTLIMSFFVACGKNKETENDSSDNVSSKTSETQNSSGDSISSELTKEELDDLFSQISVIVGTGDNETNNGSSSTGSQNNTNSTETSTGGNQNTGDSSTNQGSSNNTQSDKDNNFNAWVPLS